MGALHSGHLALVDRARASSVTVAASIFVNPLQFGPDEDFERYPRAFDADLAALDARGVAFVYAPDAEEMYRPGFSTTIDVGPLAYAFEGAVRPGHFRGVATVVAKLLHVVEPDAVFFGQKDAQQVAVIRRLVHDLDFAPQVVVCETVREADGLALSSRNAYLTPEQRAAAPSLYRALTTVARVIAGGTTHVARALDAGRRELAAPLEEDYLAVVDPDSFEELDEVRAPALVIGAARAGATRLLDNLPLPGSAARASTGKQTARARILSAAMQIEATCESS